MFAALILWNDSHEINVVPIADTKRDSKNSVKAKWGNHWYSAEIIKTSGNFDNMPHLLVAYKTDFQSNDETSDSFDSKIYL